MSKKTKIIIISAVCLVVALTVILSTSLTVGTYESRLARKMVKQGYYVLVENELLYIANGKSSCTIIEVSKESDENGESVYATVYVFKNKSDATEFYNQMKEADDDTVVQKGKKVFVGRERAISDITD